MLVASSTVVYVALKICMVTLIQLKNFDASPSTFLKFTSFGLWILVKLHNNFKFFSKLGNFFLSISGNSGNKIWCPICKTFLWLYGWVAFNDLFIFTFFQLFCLCCKAKLWALKPFWCIKNKVIKQYSRTMFCCRIK